MPSISDRPETKGRARILDVPRGTDALLRKPFDIDRLTAAIEAILAGSPKGSPA